MNTPFWFWLLWGFDALITLVILYFLFVGLFDGSVSSQNMGLWFLMVLIPLGVLLGSLYFKGAGQMGIAKTLLWLMAAPGLVAVLFLLIVIIGKPRWN